MGGSFESRSAIVDVGSKPFALQGEDASWGFPPDCMACAMGGAIGEHLSQPFLPFQCGYFLIAQE